jgi:hypothetical protein
MHWVQQSGCRLKLLHLVPKPASIRLLGNSGRKLSSRTKLHNLSLNRSRFKTPVWSALLRRLSLHRLRRLH